VPSFLPVSAGSYAYRRVWVQNWVHFGEASRGSGERLRRSLAREGDYGPLVATDILVCPPAAAYMPARSCERGARMNRSRPPFRDRDAGARRAAQASVARNKRSPVPPPFETVATPGNGPSLAAASLPAGPSEPEDQPVPWGWQSTGSDLPPAGRWYDPAVYGSGNQVIVPPQEPPAQPQPVILSAEARGESFAPPGNAVRFSPNCSLLPFCLKRWRGMK